MVEVFELRVLEFEPLTLSVYDAGIVGEDYVPTSGGQTPTPTQTYHILDEFGNVLTDGNGNRITYK